MTAVPKRRRLHFSLRTMFVLVTAVALWLGWELSIVRARRAALVELQNDPAVLIFTAEQFEGSFDESLYPDQLPKVRRLLGDKAVALIRFDAAHQPAQIDRAKEVFPEADVKEREAGIPFDGPGQIQAIP